MASLGYVLLVLAAFVHVLTAQTIMDIINQREELREVSKNSTCNVKQTHPFQYNPLNSRCLLLSLLVRMQQVYT